jgi:hypothetical protein
MAEQTIFLNALDENDTDNPRAEIARLYWKRLHTCMVLAVGALLRYEAVMDQVVETMKNMKIEIIDHQPVEGTGAASPRAF